MYIFALLGMQIFANRQHFDALGYAVPFGHPGYATAEVPRANFDTLQTAFMAVFQVGSVPGVLVLVLGLGLL
jgi:hypothetical protein